MGHLVNAVTFRLGYSVHWVDEWLVSRSVYSFVFQNSLFIRSYFYFFLSVFDFSSVGLLLCSDRLFFVNGRFVFQLYFYDQRQDVFRRFFFSRFVWRSFFSRFYKYLFFSWFRLREIFGRDFVLKFTRIQEFFFKFCLFIGFLCGDLDYFRSIFFFFIVLKEVNFFRFYDLFVLIVWNRYRNYNLIFTLYIFKFIFFRFFKSNYRLYFLFFRSYFTLEGLVGSNLRRKHSRENWFFRRIFFFFVNVFLHFYFFFNIYRGFLDLFRFSFVRFIKNIFLFPLDIKCFFVDRYGLSARYFGYFLAYRIGLLGDWWDAVRPIRNELLWLQRMSFIFGFKVQFSGRFTRRQRSVNYWFVCGRVPFSFKVASVDYHYNSVILRNGLGGVKIWLYRNHLVSSVRSCDSA